MIKTIIKKEAKILFVDLDETLLSTDTLYDSVLLFIKDKFTNIFYLVYWLFLGKSLFKEKLANSIDLSLYTFPINKEIISFINKERVKGTKIVLATATNIKTAKIISTKINIFDDVIASTGLKNLKGVFKLKAIQGYSNNKKFDYIGDSTADIPIFNEAHRAIIFNPSSYLFNKYKNKNNVLFLKKKKINKVLIWTKAIRIHQWSKNTLLFLPLIMAHRFNEFELFLDNVIAFIAFNLIASSGYIFNDLNDLEADKKHPIKLKRPFASGLISIRNGIIAISILIIFGFSISLQFLSYNFIGLLFTYLLSTITYSLYFKKKMLVDVFMLSMLYLLRIFSGGVATQTPVSIWLLVFSIFFFSSLAFMKRYVDVLMMKDSNLSLDGRNYFKSDSIIILTSGISSGYISILVFALYLSSENVSFLYNSPQILLLILPLLYYWISRLWLISHRGKMNSDPILFSIKDIMSYLILVTIIFLCFIAKFSDFNII